MFVSDNSAMMVVLVAVGLLVGVLGGGWGLVIVGGWERKRTWQQIF